MQTLIKEFYGDRLLVFGHRGARAYAPMNTIPSFELALAQSADGVELDVRLTLDEQMVIMHDDRVDATTDAKGFVHEMTLREIKELDAGSWFDPKYAGTRVPTLDEVFEAIGKRTKINVEIKSDTTDETGVEEKVADAIRRHGLARTIIVSSFNPITLARFRQAMPEVLIGFLHEPDNEAVTIPMMAELPHEARNPYYEEIDAKYMAWAKGAGYRVNTWTVNDAAKAVELRDLGVDCIITDKPDVILAAVRAQVALERLWWRLVSFGFRLLYNELAFTYDTVSWFVSLGAWRCWIGSALAHLEGASPVLELAHGTGNLQIDLHKAGYHAIGYDLSAGMGRIAQAKLARQGIEARLTRGRAQQLPFASGSFAAVVSTFPTDFIGKRETVNEVYRVLKPGGVFVIVPNAQLTGGDVSVKGLEWLYRITGQRGGGDQPTADHSAFARLFAPFAVKIATEKCSRSVVTVIVGRKNV